MKTLALICLLLLASSAASPTHAQVYPCSAPGPGEIVVGQTDAGNGIAPMQLCQRTQTPTQASQASPPKWESRWGAIATDEPHGILGSAADMHSREAAEQSAMSDCKDKGGKNCKLETWFSNGCAVLVVGDHVYNVTADSSLEKATDLGMKTCSAGGVTGC